MPKNRKRIGSDLEKVDRHVIQPHEYDEAPEFTAADFDRAEIREGSKLIRRGRPPLKHPKEAVKLRLDADVLAHFRRRGPGWQTRINATLRKATGLKTARR